jgi:outer membrane protein TolC
VPTGIPSFNLTGNIGGMALAFGNIFAAGNGFRDVSAGVTQPIFEGGTLMHRERAARAAYVQADEQYRSTVLTAFQNVADTLNALQQDADGLKAADASKDAAAVTLDLAKKQFQAGYANYLGLLSAEQAYQQAVVTLRRPKAIVMRTLPRYFRPSAVDGGTARMSHNTDRQAIPDAA